MKSKQIFVDTTNFNKNLSEADSDVQKTLETIDDLSLGGVDGVNTETITADKTLVESDDKYQLLSVASAKTVILPTTPTTGTTFWIKNNSTHNSIHPLTVKNSALEAIDYLYANAINGYIWNGSYWIGIKWNADYSGIAFEENSTTYGNFSKAHDGGTAFGRNANGYTKGAAFGESSYGNNYGAGIGMDANGSYYGFAGGTRSRTNTKYYSNALGYYSECERYGETSINIDGQSDQENNHGLIGLTVDTTNASPIRMLAGGIASQRVTIRPSSIFVFEIQIAARDNTNGDCGAYKFTGAIKRDASNNTAIVGSVTKTIIAEDDASWDVAVTADDTNDALEIEVTGDDTNTVQWVASIKYTETHF